jgi:outer membrane murein-binding lipoprotein Lpp
MKGLITYSIAIFTIFLAILSCQKQVDYGPDITQLKSDVASLKSSITSITAQLTNLEASLKAKIDLTNAKIDTINTSINTLNTKTITGLSADILAINSALKNTNTETTRRLDSIRTAILKIDTLVGVNTASASTLSDSYSKLLTNYVTLLKIVQTTTIITEISGSVFKGSFIRGSLLNFYELDTNLNQTGRSFNTTIDDDYGNFDIKAQNLAGKLIRVVGDGFYWNEVLNENSSSRITLTALCKIDSNETVNVNVLTQLERPRVEYLYSIKKLSFDSAKNQAVTEVLKAFGYTNTGIKRAEKVGVVGIGDNSKILLAISTLMQGYRTESEVTQIMSDFANDLKKDGTLDDITIGNDLATHLYYIDTATVLNNFKVKYRKLYNADTVNSIDMRFVKNFKNNTTFVKDKEIIDYPIIGSSFRYPNILNTNAIPIKGNLFDGKYELSFYAKIKKGMKVKIEIKNSDGVSYNFTSWNSNGSYFDPYLSRKGWISDAYTENSNLIKPIAESGALENELQLRLIPGTYFISYYEAVMSRESKQIKIVLP